MHPIIPLDIARHEPACDSNIFASLDVKDLLLLVQGLPVGYRIVFNLYVFEGYKHREIAETLGISEGTSKSNLSDARSFLQKSITTKKRIVHL